MFRNLKILIAAAMALAAFGAIGVSGAQAAEFHCSVEPCTITVKPDGKPGPTGKTAHHVFIVKQGATSVSSTCQQASSHATAEEKEATELTFTNIVYSACNVAGEEATIKMNGCDYRSEVGGVHHATVQIQCPAEKVIEIEAPAIGCKMTVGNTEVLGGGSTFKDAETGGVKKTEVTSETTVTNIPVTVVNNKCPELKEGAATGEITTANVELTAETDPGGVKASLWYG